MACELQVSIRCDVDPLASSAACPAPPGEGFAPQFLVCIVPSYGGVPSRRDPELGADGVTPRNAGHQAPGATDATGQVAASAGEPAAELCSTSEPDLGPTTTTHTPTGGRFAVSRLNVPAPEDVPAGAQRILDTIGAQLGFVPNMFKTIASNPTVLEVVTTLQGTLSRVLDAKTRHSIALAVSQANGCELLPGDPHLRLVRIRRHVERRHRARPRRAARSIPSAPRPLASRSGWSTAADRSATPTRGCARRRVHRPADPGDRRGRGAVPAHQLHQQRQPDRSSTSPPSARSVRPRPTEHPAPAADSAGRDGTDRLHAAADVVGTPPSPSRRASCPLVGAGSAVRSPPPPTTPRPPVDRRNPRRGPRTEPANPAPTRRHSGKARHAGLRTL